jgi:PAT family beta-lactamase induction signal transducer AmpG
VAIGDTTRSRLVLFGGLYFAQGISWGFITTAVALRLTSLGLGPAVIGSVVGYAQIPWTLKPFLGPFVDRISFGRFGRRRPLLLGAEAAMAVTLILISGLSPLSAPVLFPAMLIAHNVFAALQDVTSDALAVERLPEVERGRANGVMAAGKYGGTLVGGAGLAALSSALGWSVACFAAVALLLFPATLALLLREETAPLASTGAVTALRTLLREAVRSFALRVTALAALFCLISGASDNLLYPTILPLFRRQLGFSEGQVTLFISLAAGTAAVGSLLGGLLADRLGRRRAIVLGAVTLAAVNLAFAAAQPLWSHLAVIIVYQLFSSLGSGVLFASTLAFCMDITNPRLPATHFQLYMALLNVRNTWSAFAGGRLGEALPPAAMFSISGGVELLALALLPLLDPRRAIQAFRRAD